MGYGEFVGGGSVKWNVRHSHGGGGGMRDPDPAPGSGAKFVVYINRVAVGWTYVDGGEVVVGWDNNIDENTPIDTVKAAPPAEP